MSVGIRELDADYESEPGAVARARADIAAFVAAAGAGAALIDDVRLAVSEAVTNAVLHGYRSGPGCVRLTASVAAGELWVLVCDEGCGMQPNADRPGLGLGLGLIARVADHMTIVPRAAGGTELRMRFDLVAAADAVIGTQPRSTSVWPDVAGVVASSSRG